MEGLVGKVALVTGAASGIGAACAAHLLAEGASVGGVDVQDLVEGHAWVGDAEHAWFRSGVDVSSDVDVAAAVADISERLGPIDILINVAGVVRPGAAHVLPEDDWDRTLDVNLKGCYLTSKHVLPSMIERRSGSIVHIASTMGLEGGPGTLAYSASKGGVVSMTKAMAWDHGVQGIRVNCVCPGFIQTPLVSFVFENEEFHQRMNEFAAMGRHGQPVEIAKAVAFLASDEASFVTGHALVVDGGWMAGRSVHPPSA